MDNSIAGVKTGDWVFSTQWGWKKVIEIMDLPGMPSPVYCLDNSAMCTANGIMTYEHGAALPTIFKTPQDAIDYIRANFQTKDANKRG